MNMILKSAIAGALVLSAGSAFAAYTDANTGSSDLVLVVQNTTTNATYVLDTGISISSLMPSGSLVAGATADVNSLAGLSTTIAESPALQSFLAANPIAGDAWGIAAAQFTTANGSATNSNVRTQGLGIAIFSSSGGTTTPSNVIQATLGNLVPYLNGIAAAGTNTGPGPFFPLTTATESANGPQFSAADQQKYGLFLVNDLSAVGTSSELFGLTGNGGTGQVESYNLGQVVLNSNGSLTFTGNGGSPVPLPAAVWLLGSGLMGLVGVSRRRKASLNAA